MAEYPNPSLPEFESIDEELVERMAVSRDVVTTARSLRNEASVKVRQPLQRIVVASTHANQREALLKMQDLILEELNVKELEVMDNPESLFVLRAKPNYKALGPKFGKNVKKVVEIIENIIPDDVALFKKENRYDFTFEDHEAHITLDDVTIETDNPPDMVVQNEDGLAIGLDLKLTEELKQEGLAREFVNRVQNMRKDAGFDVMDRIKVCFEGTDELSLAVSNRSSYIMNETLADKIEDKYCDLDYSKQWSINGLSVKISIEKQKI